MDINSYFPPTDDVDLSSIDPAILNELQFVLKDVLAGDPKAQERPEYKGVNLKQIKLALDYILTNENLSGNEKNDLLSNSWRVNYKSRPPTPEEFLTEKYLGPVAPTIYPYVKEAFIEYLNPTKPYRTCVLYPFIGWGKEISRYSTKIHTPTGPKIADEIQIGDEVSTPNGKIAKVINRKTWEDEEFCTITFSDGRQVHAGLDHYWKAAKSLNSRKWNKEIKKYEKLSIQEPCWKIITTREILKSLEKNPKEHWFIPLTKPVYYKKNEHIVPPYTLGALLGDGHFGTNINLVGDDPEIHSRVESELFRGVGVKVSKTKSCSFQTTFTYNHSKGNPYKKELTRLRLREARSATKFIPTEYLYDSVSNRIALLQGLMDTDGTVVKKSGLAIFNTVSSDLKNDVITLVRGLGGFASWSLNKKNRPHCVKNLPLYNVFISFPENIFPIFSLKRKQEIIDYHFKRNSRLKRKTQYLYLTNIELTPNDEGLCIELDDEERLFLVDDCIVTHNSYLAVLVNMYVGVHMSLMKAPWKFFGQSPATVYTQVFCAESLKKSSELLFEPMLNMLESSTYFEKVHTREAMIQRDKDFDRSDNIEKIFWTTAVPTSELQFSNGANFKLISKPGGLLGQTIVTGTMTEITFFKDAGRSDQYIFNFFSKLRTRIESRMKGNYFGRFILDSSPNNLESPIDDWVVHDAPKNSSNYIIRGARWDYVKSDFPEDTFDEHGKVRPEKAFQVFIGGKGRPPAIIDPSTRNVYSPEDIIDVPNTFQMRDAFEENVYESLKDIAGIPAGTADKIFYDPVKIETIFEPRLKNLYTHIHAMSTEKPEGLIWEQVKDVLFTKYVNSYRFWRLPHVPRVFAVDQSISGDAACLSVAHLERDKDDAEKTIYVVDFTLVIVPGGGRINLDAIRFFIEDLREKGGMNFVAGSFDQFQSEATFQYLLRLGFNVEKLSVDKLMDPYLNFISIVESGRLRAGRNLHLKNNIKSLQIVKRKNANGTRTGSPKVDHTSGEVVFEGNTNWDTSAIGIHAKDAADTVCACCELLRKNNMLAYEVWDPEAIKTKTQEDMRNQLASFLKDKGLVYSDSR